MTKLLGEAEPDLVDLEEAHLHSEMDESYVRERDSLAMNPFEVMLLMQPLYWPRLEFTLGPRAAEVGSDVWQLDFRERASTAPKATIWNSFRRSVTAAASDL